MLICSNNFNLVHHLTQRVSSLTDLLSFSGGLQETASEAPVIKTPVGKRKGKKSATRQRTTRLTNTHLKGMGIDLSKDYVAPGKWFLSCTSWCWSDRWISFPCIIIQYTRTYIVRLITTPGNGICVGVVDQILYSTEEHALPWAGVCWLVRESGARDIWFMTWKRLNWISGYRGIHRQNCLPHI